MKFQLKQKYQTQKEQLEAVKGNGYNIQFIPNPSEKVQLTVVQEDGCVIEYIKNPSEEAQLAAVQDYGYAIQYIDNPPERVVIAAIMNNLQDESLSDILYLLAAKDIKWHRVEESTRELVRKAQAICTKESNSGGESNARK